MDNKQRSQEHSRDIYSAESSTGNGAFEELALVYGLCGAEPFTVRVYEYLRHDEDPA